MQYAIGIDIGTGSTKAVALSASGKPLASVQTQYQNTDSEKDITEQNPETIWEAFKQCLSQTIDKIKEPPAIICLSSYMHGIMAVDQNGAPLTKLITWADTRADDIAAELRQSPEAALLYRTTGTPLHS
ncbi:MAG TPA: FGGY family carbohydrate kinase, partial [Flavisolibacter sp.]|nr:FGGY family carbohydrate kinase [Flavisolibacter sp.]